MQRDRAARPVGELGLSERDRRACGASGGRWLVRDAVVLVCVASTVRGHAAFARPSGRTRARGRLAADSAPSGRNRTQSGRPVQGAARAPPDPAIWPVKLHSPPDLAT